MSRDPRSWHSLQMVVAQMLEHNQSFLVREPTVSRNWLGPLEFIAEHGYLHVGDCYGLGPGAEVPWACTLAGCQAAREQEAFTIAQ